MNDVTKLTVNIANDNLAIVKELASKQSTNMTTVINKAIQVEKFIQEVRDRGEKILIEDRSGKVKEVIFR